MWSTFLFLLWTLWTLSQQCKASTTAEPQCIPADVPRVAAALTSRHYHRMRPYDNSRCPTDSSWFLAMAAVDAAFASAAPSSSTSQATFINIGMNKGFNFAIWLRIFVPGYEDFTGFQWQTLLAAWERAENTTLSASCGACNDCVFNLPQGTGSEGKGVAASVGGVGVTFVGVDLNAHNVRLIESASHQLASTSNATRQRAPLQWKLHHAAAGNESGKLVNAYHCGPGMEECSLAAGRGGQRVRMLTVDEIVANMTSRSIIISSSSSSSKLVEVLMIDAEGHDCSVLQGARETLQRRQARCVIFEYHDLPPWSSTNLSSVVSWLHSAGYECYFQGQERLWPVSGPCWSPEYEFHSHSNVMCLERADRWFAAVQRFVVSSAAAIEKQFDKYRGTYEGKVVRSPQKRFNKLIFLVANSTKSPFRNAAAFLRRGYSWQDVILAEAEALALLQDGPWIE